MSVAEPAPVTRPVTPEPWAGVHETHSGVVVLLGSQALKFKKPVDFGFLDFTTVERRRRACEREVELNRRLAPDVYTGVGSLRGPEGDVVDHVVMMGRMPAERRLSTLVRDGVDVDAQLRDVARQLAAFHARAERGATISRDVDGQALGMLWRSSFEEVAAHPVQVPPAVQAEIVALVESYLAGRGGLLDERAAGGHVLDGHGDLMAEDIFSLDDGCRILDCLEFDDRLRHVDQVDDAAFLAMDLEHLGAPELGARFLELYAEFSGDHAPPNLVEHYLAYRAYVRAKVACLRHDQGDADGGADAGRFAAAALTHLRRAAVVLVVVGGSPGTGKSTLSAGLADRLGMTVVSSDRVRKELARLIPTARTIHGAGEGIYTEAWTRRVYAEMLRRAALLLSRGESVVLDASWAVAAHRGHAREVASSCSAGLVEIRCVVPAAVAEARVVSRELVSAAGTVSDATTDIAAGLRAGFEPWADAHVVDSGRGVLTGLEHALGLVRPHDEAAVRHPLLPGWSD